MTETKTTFWKRPPAQPGHDLRFWSLLIPAAFSALGFCAFGVLAFSFTELQLLGSLRTWLVVIGAVSLAIGGEVGTLGATIEVYRKSQVLKTKQRKDRQSGETRTIEYSDAVWWDWVGLVVSLCATFLEFVIAFAALLGVNATWGPTVRLYGPIVLGVMSALDAYVNFMEVGLYLSQYDKRYKKWEEERNAALRPETSNPQVVTAVHSPELRPQLSAGTDLQSASSPQLIELHYPQSASAELPIEPPRISLEFPERARRTYEYYSEHPGETFVTAGKALEISDKTVANHVRALEAAGVMRRNGHGWKVVETEA